MSTEEAREAALDLLLARTRVEGGERLVVRQILREALAAGVVEGIRQTREAALTVEGVVSHDGVSVFKRDIANAIDALGGEQ